MKKGILKNLSKLKSLSSISGRVLGINQRNLLYIYPENARRNFPLADDKLQTKEIMESIGVPVPRTYHIYRHFYELYHLEKDLASHDEFVIKPSKGRAGGGIIILKERRDSEWIGIGGRVYSIPELSKHISDITFGVYCFDLQDAAIIEERVKQHPEMNVLSPLGLADVRVILYKNQPVLAMTRIPTEKSNGMANLHRGAVGVGINLDSGRTEPAVLGGSGVGQHPDTGVPLLGHIIPFWNEIILMARAAAEALPLKYIGADISISETGPVLLEVNARPGLEIQNANLKGLRPVLQAIRDG